MHVPCLNFKPFHIAVSEVCHIAVGMLTQVMSLVVILSASMLLFQCHVTCQNFTPTGPWDCLLLIKLLDLNQP